MQFNQSELLGKWFAIHIAAGLLVVQHNGEEDSWGSGGLEGKAYNTNLFLDEENNLCANVFECTQKNEDGTWNNDESIEINVLGVHLASVEPTAFEHLQTKIQPIIDEYRENYEIKSFEDLKDLPVGTELYRISGSTVMMEHLHFMGVHPFAANYLMFCHNHDHINISIQYINHFRKGIYFIRKRGLEKKSRAICKFLHNQMINTDLTNDMEEILTISSK